MGIITEAVMSNLELSNIKLTTAKEQLVAAASALEVGIRNPFYRDEIRNKILFIISEIDKIKDFTDDSLDKEINSI